MNKTYLVSIPGAGGLYGLIAGAIFVAIDKIKSADPSAEIHYSGVSSGSVTAVLLLISQKYGYDFHELHKEFVEDIKEQGEWKKGQWKISITDYYNNNALVYKNVNKFIRKYVTDINDINGKIHIGYSRIDSNKLVFEVVSEFTDVDDLIGAILASAHYPFLLKPEFYCEYRGHKCLDGVFIKRNIHLPNYKNVRISDDIYKNYKIGDHVLYPDHDHYLQLFKRGEQNQKESFIDIFELAITSSNEVKIIHGYSIDCTSQDTNNKNDENDDNNENASVHIDEIMTDSSNEIEMDRLNNDQDDDKKIQKWEKHKELEKLVVSDTPCFSISMGYIILLLSSFSRCTGL